MQETLNSKKQGDSAFRAKDFTNAIDCYTQVPPYIVLYCQHKESDRHDNLAKLYLLLLSNVEAETLGSLQ